MCRVPVLNSHSESINIEFEEDYNLSDLKNTLAKAPGCKVLDHKRMEVILHQSKLKVAIPHIFQE